MYMTNRLKNQHLLWRAGFGPMAENSAKLDQISQKELWHVLVKTSREMPEKIDVSENLVEGFLKGVKDAQELQKLEKEHKQTITQLRIDMRKKSGEELKSLNHIWLGKMINSEAQLREKMSLFWHGHFACRVINGYYQQELLHDIRSYSLGSFRDLLRAASKSPAMIQFLNNQQNRKQHPNENFAREVMELFTLGRGNYTEGDVKEAARAFTGWGSNIKSEFAIKPIFHDSGVKTFMGKTGNFTGDDILDILLEQKQTARFITAKIYRFFVNEKVDDDHVRPLAEKFYQSDYDILALLGDIFTSDWFYDQKNIGNRIKSPVELLAGIRRFLPMELENENGQLLYQKILGQTLFYPPNVAGWPGGKSWIDSSSLMVRLQIPRVFAFNDEISLDSKDDDDLEMGKGKERRRSGAFVARAGSATINWAPVIKVFEGTPREQLDDSIAASLLQTESRVRKDLLASYSDRRGREVFIKSQVIQWMCTPEYQLA